LSIKLLTVAGVPLSLDDIQFTILRQNYNNDPLIMYGLYQGIIGGPNIRKKAYTGENVYKSLKSNAIEFTNSNRGTYSKSEKSFRVSSLYERNEVYFVDFDSDLTEHLLVYLEGYEQTMLKSATSLKADINDWTITDLGGSYRDVGGSFATNNAALLNSVKSTVTNTNEGTPGGLGAVMNTTGYGSSTMAAKGKSMSRIPPELLVQLHELNLKRENANYDKANVTIEELGEFPPDPNAVNDSENDDNN